MPNIGIILQVISADINSDELIMADQDILFIHLIVF
jgi:hypothetical protein